jgi:hypothetical protein
MNDQERNRTDDRAEQKITKLKWIFGTTYTVQGSSALSDIPTLYLLSSFSKWATPAANSFNRSNRSAGW